MGSLTYLNTNKALYELLLKLKSMLISYAKPVPYNFLSE